MIDKADEASIEKLKTYIETTYNPIPKDEQERLIDGLVTLIQMGQNKRDSLRSVLEYVTKMIFKYFDFHEIGIGVKSRRDQLFRYEILFGYRKDLQDQFAKVAYTYEDMVEYHRFPYVKMGKLTDLVFAEGMPDKEKVLFARPIQLDAVRQSLDTFHEGDYIDVYMHGPNRKLLGWIELSSPLTRKLPTRSTIRWLELIATICGYIISEKWKDEGAVRK